MMRMAFDPAAAFDAERFRREGRAVIDWLADYWQSLPEKPVLSQVEPDGVRSQLPTHAPEQPESLDAVLADPEFLHAHLAVALRACHRLPGAGAFCPLDLRALDRLS